MNIYCFLLVAQMSTASKIKESSKDELLHQMFDFYARYEAIVDMDKF